MSRIKKFKWGDTVYDVGPNKTSELQNDAGFITSASLPTKVSDLTNDAGFITSASLPTKISDLTDDSNFIEDTDYATTSKGGTIKLSDLYCTDIYNGVLMAKTISASDLDNANGYAFVSMQTMRNQLYKYLTTAQAENVFATKSSLSSAMSEVYSALNSGLNSVASSIPHKTSDLNNDSGFLSMPWYYQTEGPSVDASVKINAMITTYGKVVLGPGTYYLKNNIVLRTGQSIEGMGLQTILKWDSIQSNSENIIYILSNTSVSTVDRIYIKNLCIRGIEDSEVASLIDYVSSSIPDVIRGIDFYSSNTDNGIITKDHPLVIEDVVFENLSYGIFDRLSSGYEVNPSMGSTDYEPITDRLIVRNCTFRNCYRSYYEDRSESYPSGMVRVENCIFNKFREAIRIKHMGITISNCSFYHSYYRTMSTSSGDINYFDNLPITVHNCRFYAPCVDNVMHISFNLIGTKEPLIVVSDSFFEFGKLNNTAYRHIYSSSRMIINNCNFKMRAIGSVNNNLIQFAITRVNKVAMIMNSITDTNVVSLGSPINIVNSFKDDGSSFLAN